MKKLKRKIKLLSKTAVGCVGFVVIIFILSFGINIAKAAWEDPSAEAPESNIFTPLNAGPDDQAKKGRLLLDPLYNPEGSVPGIDNTLEVRGTHNTFFNMIEIPSESEVAGSGTLLVDTDSLYVDPAEHRVGIGTLEPATLVEIEDGFVRVGSSTNPITTGPAIYAQSNASYGVYGASATTSGSVYGSGITEPGVYGLTVGSGAGVRAESVSGPAVVGSTTSSLDPITKIAGIYASARGLGSWAGYFAQRLFSTDEIVGNKFVPNRLQYAAMPYTAGWEVQEIGGSWQAHPSEIVFDGTYIWAIQMYDWAIEPYAWLLDPATGGLVDEFRIVDGSGDVGHAPQEAILAGGYIWIANAYDDRGLTRVDPTTYVAVHYQTGTHAGDGNDGPIDLVYDDQSAGGPYIWTVNEITADSTYSVTRFKISDSTYTEYDPFQATQQCPTFDTNLCNDDIDNDSDTFTDSDDPDCTNPPFSVDPANVGDYESVDLIDLNVPTGIALQSNGAEPANPTFWISFGGYTKSEGEGIAKFSADDPVGTFTHYCTGPARGPSDIAYGGGYVWVANYPHYDKPQDPYEGFTRFDPDTEVADHYYVYVGARKIEFDDQSAGGPYVWLSNLWELLKYDTSGNEVHLYPLLDGGGGFDFDRTSGANDYVWSAHSTAGSVSRNMIDNPYTTNTYLIKGALSVGIVFDGTYIWSANRYGNTVSKYRASDGVKIGDYEAGWHPHQIVFDGTYIWTRHHGRYSDTTDLTQIRASDGAKVGSYDYTFRYNAYDMIFDGTYLWVSDGTDNELRRIDTTTCEAGTCTMIEYPVSNSPDQMVFDGEYVWVMHREQCSIDSEAFDNCFSKINPSDGSVLATYSIPGAYEADHNLRAIEFDGTYLWIGTQHVDNEGNSVYKVDPDDGTVAGKYRIYTEPGLCSGGDRDELYCTRNADCTGGGTCSAHSAEIRAIGFDGTQIWVLQGRVISSSPARECNDDTNNDPDEEGPNPEDKLCDYNGCCEDGTSKNQTNCEGAFLEWYEPDPQCEDWRDLHENDTGFECSDGLDNNGNGLCDYDGAVGSPGCSGKPDPSCSSADDKSEATDIRSTTHLTRIMAATGEVVESIPYGDYCSGDADIVFDGMSVWFNEEAGCGGYALYQYYAGSGLGSTDFGNTVSLQPRLPGTAQPGSFSMVGSANFGANLTVVEDLVVPGNIWGGTVDNERDFGVGCDDGEFVKGVDITSGSETLRCRPL